MARGRMLNRTVATSGKVAKLIEAHGVEAGLFFTWMIPWLDKWGNIRADRYWLKASIVPRVDAISADDCERFLRALADHGLVQFYEVEGMPYAHVPGFLGNQVGLRTDREGTDIPTPPEWPSDKPFSAGDWERLRIAYNYTCLGCGRKDQTVTLSPDHIIPLIRGGADIVENVQPLCQPCNMRKSTRVGDFRPPQTIDAVLTWVRGTGSKESRPQSIPKGWTYGMVSDPPKDLATHPARESGGEWPSGGARADLVWSESGVRWE